MKKIRLFQFGIIRDKASDVKICKRTTQVQNRHKMPVHECRKGDGWTKKQRIKLDTTHCVKQKETNQIIVAMKTILVEESQ